MSPKKLTQCTRAYIRVIKYMNNINANPYLLIYTLFKACQLNLLASTTKNALKEIKLTL